jgi:hypothetical protein
MVMDWHRWMTRDERRMYTVEQADRIIRSLRARGYGIAYDNTGWWVRAPDRSDYLLSSATFEAVADLHAEVAPEK